MSEEEKIGGKFPSLLILLQGLLLVLFVVFVEYETDVLPNAEETPKIDSKFSAFHDLHSLLLIGFGLLMTFLKRYGFSGLGYNFLISALTMQWSTMMDGFFQMEDNKVRIGIDSMIRADLSAIAVLITFGAVLGKTSHLQLLVISFLETIFYVTNRNICIKYLHAVDPGGSIFIHIFGCCFGLVIARVLYSKKVVGHEKETSRYTSDLFGIVGTIFLWVYWPSFNTVLLDGTLRYRAIINTYYAMASSCVTAFAFSSIVTKHSKLSMVHVQNSTLAGGVAVGAIAAMIIHPWGAILIGILGGIVSTLGYKYVQPILIRKFHIHDTCGVNSLHGIPGLLAAVASIVAAGLANYNQYKTSLYTVFPARAPIMNSTQYFELAKFVPDAPSGLGRSAASQAGFQSAALALTVAMSSVGGLITGVFHIKVSGTIPKVSDSFGWSRC